MPYYKYAYEYCAEDLIRLTIDRLHIVGELI